MPTIQEQIDVILKEEMLRLRKVSKTAKTPMDYTEFKKLESIQKIDRLAKELPTEILNHNNTAEKLTDAELLKKLKK
jgi:hypothetical protein